MKELTGEPTQNCATCQYRKRKGSGKFKGVLIRDPDFYGKCCRPEGVCERLEMIDLEKLYKVCPNCGHDWTAHFQMVDKDGSLITPTASPCIECAAPGCGLAQEREKLRKEAQEPPEGEDENKIILEAMEPNKKEAKASPDPRQMELFT